MSSPASGVKALIVWSGRSRPAFIAGADIHEIRAVPNAADATEKSRRGQRIFSKLAALPAVTIARRHCPACGTGSRSRATSGSRATRPDEIGLPSAARILPGFGGRNASRGSSESAVRCR
jgi:enoyl-CoA hydratase/carnithine racemase